MGISAKSSICYQFKALTDVWTGSVDGKSDRIVTTGLLGSIRWWFEVLVRGLGGSACDPTDTKCEGRKHCVVCELFGCTGWARKFRFEVLDGDGTIKTNRIKQNETFSIRFTSLRPFPKEEQTLLDATLRLIAEYGAIGGKTVFKPTEEQKRQGETHHKDFGLIEVLNVDPPITGIDVTRLKNYVYDDRWKKPEPKEKDTDFAWASLKYFWFVNEKSLSRENINKSTFNKVLGRKESKACRDCGHVHNPPQKCPKTEQHPKRFSECFVNDNDKVSKWLAGSQRESKKVFSFKNPPRRPRSTGLGPGYSAQSKKVFSFKNPPRTFGFVKPGLIDLDTMKKRLQDVWGKDGWEFLTGEKIIDQLFAKEEDRS